MFDPKSYVIFSLLTLKKKTKIVEIDVENRIVIS